MDGIKQIGDIYLYDYTPESLKARNELGPCFDCGHSPSAHGHPDIFTGDGRGGYLYNCMTWITQTRECKCTAYRPVPFYMVKE